MKEEISETLRRSNQQDLQTFCLAIILAAQEESRGRAHKQAGFEFLFLKTIIDSLDP